MAQAYVASAAGRRFIITEEDRVAIQESTSLDDPWITLDSGIEINASLVTDIEKAGH